MGYFWFGEQTMPQWAMEQAVEGATIAGGIHLYKNPKHARAVARVGGRAALATGRVGARYGSRLAWQAGKIAARSSWQLGRAAMTTPIARGVSAGHVALGYAIGATVGTAIAYAGWGTEGAKDAIDLYTGGVSVGEYFETVGDAIDKSLPW